MDQTLIDVEDAATRLGTSKRHIRHLVTTRRIPFTRVGRLIRFRTTDLDRWLDEHAVPEGGEAA